MPDLLRRYRPADYDVTITCSYPFTNWALRRPVLGGSRPPHVYVTQNGDWPAQSNQSEFRLFGCEGLVCTNPEYFERNKNRWRCALIPNGVDCNRFFPGAAERQQFGLPADRLVVLMVSALIPSKRVDVGIEALSHIPDAYLVVAGDGPMRQQVDAAAARLLPGRFTRLSVAPEKMPLLYRSADVFLHLSKDEPSSLAFVEALACGLPVVAHDSLRMRHIAGDDEFLLDAEEPTAISQQVERARRSTLAQSKKRAERATAILLAEHGRKVPAVLPGDHRVLGPRTAHLPSPNYPRLCCALTLCFAITACYPVGMAPILVTGGAGYIGSHTCKLLAGEGFTFVVFDNLSRGHADLVQGGQLVTGDVLDPAALDEAFNRHRPQGVIHFAALAYVGESVAEPVSYYRVNVSGMINLLDTMVRHGTEKIIFSSSCATYGIPDSVPIPETAPQRPISPYGRSKLVCEQILKDVAAAKGIRYGILRYFNASGADSSGRLKERHDPETHLIPLTIDAASGMGPPLNIFGNDYPTPDGTCERDYIHVSDLAAAHVASLRYLERGGASFEANVGSGRAHSVLQVVAMVEKIVGRKVPVVWTPRRAGDPPALYADPTVADRLIGFRARHSDLENIVDTAWRSRRPPNYA